MLARGLLSGYFESGTHHYDHSTYRISVLANEVQNRAFDARHVCGHVLGLFGKLLLLSFGAKTKNLKPMR